MEPRSYVATMLAGAAAGALPRILTHPLDTCKARIQVRTPSASAKLRGGLIAELVHSARSEGVRSLYRGFPTAFWGAAPAGCLYFGCYEACKDALSPYVGPAGSGSAATAHLLAGLVAEAASCVLWVPIDVVKERLQVQSTLWKEAGAGTANANAGGAPPRGKSMLLYRGNVDAFASIISNEGVRGLYRGYGATLLSFGPFSAIFFMLNEQFKAAWVRWSGLDLQGKGPEALLYPTLCFASSGAAAGSIAAFITNPMDMAKLRLQVQRGAIAANAANAAASTAAASASATANSATASSTTFSTSWPQYKSLLDGMTQIVRKEGAAALFKGAFARVAFQAPTTTIAITSFETLRLQFEKVV